MQHTGGGETVAWIESHEGLARHPKTKKLARLLGENVPSAIGRLHLLWWWALEYAQDGNLSRYDPEDIADALMWEGEAAVVVEALCTAGFLDTDEDGAFHIHDWNEYAGRLIEQREKNAERKRRSRQRHASVTRTSRVTDVAVTGLPNLTIPNQTIDLKDLAPSADADEARADTQDAGGAQSSKTGKGENAPAEKPANEYTADFEAFWAAYPRKVEKKGAFKAWQARLKAGVDPQELILAARNYADRCRQLGTEIQFIKHAKTFLGPSEPYQEYVKPSDGGVAVEYQVHRGANRAYGIQPFRRSITGGKVGRV
jgi:hypothetical protein